MQLTASDVARVCGVSESEVYRWVERLDLPARRKNTQCHFQPAELLEWASRHQINVSPALFKSGQSDQSRPLTLAAALDRGGVATHPGGVDQPALLEFVLQGLPLPARFDRAALLSLLVARDQLGGAALGDGIAIPHPHYPVVLPIPEPIVRICYLETPFATATADGKPIEVLFLLVCPTVRHHLQLLARTTHALRDAEFRDAIRRRRPQAELLAILHRLELGAPGQDVREGVE